MRRRSRSRPWRSRRTVRLSLVTGDSPLPHQRGATPAAARTWHRLALPARSLRAAPEPERSDELRHFESSEHRIPPWRFQLHRDGQALAARPRSANRGQRSSCRVMARERIGQCPMHALSRSIHGCRATQVLTVQVPPVSAFPQVREFRPYATRAVHGWKSRCNTRCNRPGHTTASVVEVGTSVARGLLCVLRAPERRVRAMEPIADSSMALRWPHAREHPSNQAQCLRGKGHLGPQSARSSPTAVGA